MLVNQQTSPTRPWQRQRQRREDRGWFTARASYKFAELFPVWKKGVTFTDRDIRVCIIRYSPLCSLAKEACYLIIA